MPDDERSDLCPGCLEEYVRRIDESGAFDLRPDESSICFVEREVVYTH